MKQLFLVLCLLAWSSTASAAYPPAPTGLTIQSVEGGLSLSWGTHSLAEGWYIYRCEVSCSTSSNYVRITPQAITEPVFVDSLVVPGKRYWYRVTATGGESGRSSAVSMVVSALPPPPPPPPVSVSLAPTSASILAGATQQFVATVGNATNSTVVWSATGGTISSDGTFTAPPSAGTFTVSATSVQDPTKSASASIVVTVPPPPPPPPPGDLTAGLLTADRATKWVPGLNGVGGVPARATICRTVNPPAGDAVATIQAAIDACPAGQVVQLAAGTFQITGSNVIFLNKGVTLRGAGPGQTLLLKANGAKPNSYFPGPGGPAPIIIVGPARWSNNPHGVSASTNLTANGVKGSTSVTVASTSGFAVGQYVLVDERSGAAWRSDPAGRGQILASADFRVVWQKHNPGQGTDDPIAFNATTGQIGNGSDAASWFCRQDRPTSEIKRIAAIAGDSITFDSPLHIDYRVSNTAQVSRFEYVFTENAGVEDLKVLGGDNGNIRFNWAARSWLKNIEVQQWLDEGIAVDHSTRIEIRDSYVHDAAWASPGGGGYAISLSSGTSDVLIENNVVVRANKVMVARSSGAGSVVGYNYMDQGYINGNGAWIEIGLNASHMVGPHHVLFEGNYGFNADSDKTHGNSIYHTYFRNHLRGIRARFTNQAGGIIDDANQPGNGPRRAVGLGYYSYWMSFIGNVLGAAGQMNGWTYETSFTGGPGIWMLGWDDWSPYPMDPRVKTLTLRHGNYDYLTNSIAWDPSVAQQTLPPSFYLTQKPAFFGDLPWPWVDPNGSTKLHTLPAKARFDAMP